MIILITLVALDVVATSAVFILLYKHMRVKVYNKVTLDVDGERMISIIKEAEKKTKLV
jgi:hypothetical protein